MPGLSQFGSHWASPPRGTSAQCLIVPFNRRSHQQTMIWLWSMPGGMPTSAFGAHGWDKTAVAEGFSSGTGNHSLFMWRPLTKPWPLPIPTFGGFLYTILWEECTLLRKSMHITTYLLTNNNGLQSSWPQVWHIFTFILYSHCSPQSPWSWRSSFLSELQYYIAFQCTFTIACLL